jgi:site-specific DNA-methyltransferase (adenine-specific)
VKTPPINEIICGDNVETLATFPDACIDLVVTSPPYDNLRTYGGHSWDFEGVAQQLWRVIKPGGVVVWVVADATIDGSETGTSFRQALRFMEIGFRLHDTMIWEKPPAGANGSNLCYPQSCEFMFVLSKNTPENVSRIADRKNITAGLPQRRSTGGRCAANNAGAVDRSPSTITPEFGLRTNVWKYNVGNNLNDDNGAHPAIFPEALARDHILSWSNEGDIVLDPFSGSGTTAKMARLMGRQYIGIEVNPEYCEIAANRLRQSVFAFDEVCA